jgi:hypothetical protein
MLDGENANNTFEPEIEGGDSSGKDNSKEGSETQKGNEDEKEVVEDPKKTVESDEPGSKSDKTAIQKRIDQLTYERRKAEQERDRVLTLLEKTIPGKEKEPEVKEPTEFKDIEEYTDYLVEKKLAEKINQANQKAQKDAVQARLEENVANFKTRTEKFAVEHEDFYDKVNDPSLRVSDAMTDALIEAENGPAIAYWLAENPAELAKINQMSEFNQVMALGRIDAKFSSGSTDVAKKGSSAPAPIKPLKGGASMEDGPSDKDDIKTWMAKETARLKKAGRIR